MNCDPGAVGCPLDLDTGNAGRIEAFLDHPPDHQVFVQEFAELLTIRVPLALPVLDDTKPQPVWGVLFDPRVAPPSDVSVDVAVRLVLFAQHNRDMAGALADPTSHSPGSGPDSL